MLRGGSSLASVKISVDRFPFLDFSSNIKMIFRLILTFFIPCATGTLAGIIITEKGSQNC